MGRGPKAPPLVSFYLTAYIVCVGAHTGHPGLEPTERDVSKFRNNLWGLHKDGAAFWRQLGAGHAVVLVMEGEYWGLWTLKPNRTFWAPVKVQKKRPAWARVVEEDYKVRTGGDGDYHKLLKFDRASRALAASCKTWAQKQPSWPVYESWGLKPRAKQALTKGNTLRLWAQVHGCDEAFAEWDKWTEQPTDFWISPRSDVNDLGWIFAHSSTNWRRRLVKRLKENPKSLLALVQNMHPRQSKGHLRKCLASPIAQTPEHLACSRRFAGERVPPTKKELRFWRRGYSVLESQGLLWLSEHWRYACELSAELEVPLPEGVHFDLDRLPNKAAIQNMEARTQEAITQLRGIKRLRSIEEYEKHSSELTALYQRRLKGGEGYRPLTTEAEFVQEGHEMTHCAGSIHWPEEVERQSKGKEVCYYFSLEREGERSTLMIAKDGRVVQHYQSYNRFVSEKQREFANEIIREFLNG